MTTNEFGKYYWWVRLTNGQEVGVYADRVEVTGDGTLVLYGGGQSAGAKFVNLAVGAGEWQLIYAASAEDGRPLAVEHWQKRRS
jgi:hypothetical protein